MPKDNESDIASALLKVAHRSESYQSDVASDLSKAAHSSGSHWQQFAPSDARQGFSSPASKIVTLESERRTPTCPPDLSWWRRQFHPSLVSAIPASLQITFQASPPANSVTYPLPKRNVSTVFVLSQLIFLRDHHLRKHLLTTASVQTAVCCRYNRESPR